MAVPPPPQYANLPRVSAGGPAPNLPYGMPGAPVPGQPGQPWGPAGGSPPLGQPWPGSGKAMGSKSSSGGRSAMLLFSTILPIALGVGAYLFRFQIGNLFMSGSGMSISEIGITARDKKHVDMTDLIRQGRAAALKVNSHAVLTTAVIQKTVGGTVDATGDNTADLTFSWNYHDATKPAGADVVEGSMILAVYGGAFRTSTSTSTMGSDKPLPDPGCTSQAAWASAVASGVPANALGSMHLYDNSSFSPTSPIVWSIRVAGHDELRRELDARDCRLVKSWAK